MPETNEAPFDAVAPSYDKHVAPTFRVTAQDLVELADPQPGENILDVGTGPGVAALLATPKIAPTGSVVGVDIAEAMLATARENAEKEGLNVEFRYADAEALDFLEGSFDVVLSSFGIAITDPDKSLPSIRRVLKTGGRFALSQWVPTSRPAKVLFDLFQKRRVTETTPRLEWLRNADMTTRSWHNEFNTPEAIAGLLTAHGFNNVQAEVRTYSFTHTNSDAFLDWSLSFPLSNAEFEALSPGSQRMFRHEFNAAMAPFRGPKRSIISEDSILFAIATV